MANVWQQLVYIKPSARKEIFEVALGESLKNIGMTVRWLRKISFFQNIVQSPSFALLWHEFDTFSSEDRSVSPRNDPALLNINLRKPLCSSVNDRSLTNQCGLSNSLNLTHEDLYVRLVDENSKKTTASLMAVPSPSRAHYDFPPLLRPATSAMYLRRHLGKVHLI